MSDIRQSKSVHRCDECGNWTDEPCTDEEAIRDYGMAYEADWEGDGPVWWCPKCQ